MFVVEDIVIPHPPMNIDGDVMTSKLIQYMESTVFPRVIRSGGTWCSAPVVYTEKDQIVLVPVVIKRYDFIKGEAAWLQNTKEPKSIRDFLIKYIDNVLSFPHISKDNRYVGSWEFLIAKDNEGNPVFSQACYVTD